MPDEIGPRVTRRQYLTGTSLLAAAVLAGCPGNSGGSTATDDDSDVVTDGTAGTATTTRTPTRTETDSTDDSDGEYEPLRVAHWWTAGGGNDAIRALMDGFRKRNPAVPVDMEYLERGATPRLRDRIRRRIRGGDPPSTWQAWPGANLRALAEDDLLNDVESVWDETGMLSATTEGVRRAARPDGDYVAVPLDVHRLNNLFYNVEVVESAGIDPNSLSTPRQLLDALGTVATATDATPLAHQTRAPWSTLQLWETVLLAEHGTGPYRTFLSGDVAGVERQVRDTLDIVDQYLQYVGDDAGSIAWTQANKRVIGGEAAFIHQGDWAAGAYRGAEDFAFETDWDQVPFPGTAGLYALVMDSFPSPVNNPSPRATTAFLRYCGSVEGQALFNAEKGSIPPRTDVPDDRFGPFLTRQKRDYANSTAQPHSITHGLGVGPETLSTLKGAMSQFVETRDVDATVDAFPTTF